MPWEWPISAIESWVACRFRAPGPRTSPCSAGTSARNCSSAWRSSASMRARRMASSGPRPARPSGTSSSGAAWFPMATLITRSCANYARPADRPGSGTITWWSGAKMEPAMRLLTNLRLLGFGLLLALGSGSSVMAQGYSYPQQSQPQQQGYRDPRAYPPGYYPGKLVQPAQPQQG